MCYFKGDMSIITKDFQEYLGGDFNKESPPLENIQKMLSRQKKLLYVMDSCVIIKERE